MRKNRLKVKKMNGIVYVSACLLIASSLIIALIVGLAEFGFLNLRGINLIIETESAAKVYDGKPLEGTAYEIVYGRLEPGHSISIMSNSSQTTVGVALNRLEFIICDSSGHDVTDQYNIEQRYGRLAVSLREVALRIHSASKLYDGTPLSNTGIDIISKQKLAEGHTAYVFNPPEIVKVGEIANNGTVQILDEGGMDVTSQYALTVEEGTLRIDPHPITFTTGSADKIYDGTPLVYHDWSLTDGSLSSGHQLSIKCIGSITETGEVANEASVKILDKDGADVTDQYNIKMNCGTLTVNRRSLYITTSSAEKVYDSTALKSDSWEITSGSLDPGDKIELVGCTELNDVGTVPNQLTFAIWDATGKDVSSRYEIHQNTGWLTVKPRKISVSTGSAQKKYDGTPLFSEKWKLISGSLCTDHSFSIVCVRRTEIGISENLIISFAIYQERNGVRTDVTDCYQVTFSYGTLTVKP